MCNKCLGVANRAEKSGKGRIEKKKKINAYRRPTMFAPQRGTAALVYIGLAPKGSLRWAV